MRILFIMTIAFAAQTLVLNAQVPGEQAQSRQVQDYVFGRTVGECLVSKCAVFTGRLLTSSPRSGEPVAVQVDVVLWGQTHHAGNVVQLPYEAAGDVSKAPESDLARAWQGVSLVRNSPVTVVLAPERIGTVSAGTPAVVTDSARESEAIRILAEQARQLETSPASISGAVSNLAA